MHRGQICDASTYFRLNLGHGCPSGVSYYSIQPHKDLRIVFADGYDISVLGWPKGAGGGHKPTGGSVRQAGV